jgi:hypothetical protein
MTEEPTNTVRPDARGESTDAGADDQLSRLLDSYGEAERQRTPTDALDRAATAAAALAAARQPDAAMHNAQLASDQPSVEGKPRAGWRLAVVATAGVAIAACVAVIATISLDPAGTAPAGEHGLSASRGVPPSTSTEPSGGTLAANDIAAVNDDLGEWLDALDAIQPGGDARDDDRFATSDDRLDDPLDDLWAADTELTLQGVTF